MSLLICSEERPSYQSGLATNAAEALPEWEWFWNHTPRPGGLLIPFERGGRIPRSLGHAVVTPGSQLPFWAMGEKGFVNRWDNLADDHWVIKNAGGGTYDALDGLDTFSVFGYVKILGIDAGNQTIFEQFGGNSRQLRVSVRLNGSSGQWECYVGGEQGGNPYTSAIGGTSQVGLWYAVVAVLSPGVLKLYVNDQLVAASPKEGSDSTGSDGVFEMHVGNTKSSANRNWQGDMKLVGIHPGVAWTPSQVTQWSADPVGPLRTSLMVPFVAESEPPPPFEPIGGEIGAWVPTISGDTDAGDLI